MLIKAIKTSVFEEGESLLDFVCAHVKNLKENSVLVITSKIVALSEGRVREIKNKKTREELIKAESQWAMKTKYAWLTIRDNMVIPSAGIDESNANGKIILLPSDSFKTAYEIRNKLKKIYKLKNLGVLITDSRSIPLKAGIVGVAMGYAGFKGIKDYRGTADIFGRILRHSRTDVADSLAAAAVLVMGEGLECQPLCVINDAPLEFKNTIDRNELAINIREDLYQPLFAKIKTIKWKRK